MADVKSDIGKMPSSLNADGNPLSGSYEDAYAYITNPVRVSGYGVNLI